MTNLALHPRAKQHAERLARRLPHAILLAGDVGVGLLTLSRLIAGKNAIVVSPDPKAGSIAVKTIRDLYDQTKSRSQRRVVIIDDADTMTAHAQNALLKLLEEPTANTHFILCSHHPARLLSTIHSRVQQIDIPRISETDTAQFITTHAPTLSETERGQLGFMAMGRPALIKQILDDETLLRQRLATARDAKQYLSTADRYQKLVVAKAHFGSRQLAIAFIDAVASMAWLLAGTHGHDSQRYLGILERCTRVTESLERNANPKAQLLSFVIQ